MLAIAKINSFNPQNMVASPPNLTQPFWHGLLNALPQPIFVKDSHHRISDANTAFCNWLGYTKETLLGKSSYDLVPTEQTASVRAQNNLVFTSGQAQQHDLYLTNAAGIVYLAQVSASLVQDDTGCVYLVSVVQHRVEWSPRGHQSRLGQPHFGLRRGNQPPTESFLPGNRAREFYLRVQRQGHCVDYSLPQGAQRSPMTHLAQILPATVLATQLHCIQQVLATGKSEFGRLPIQQNGKLYDGEIQTIPCWPDAVLIILRISTADSPSEIIHSQVNDDTLDPLSRSTALRDIKTQFLAMVAHEFRTPLTTIRTAVDLLKSFNMSEAEREELFQQIYVALEQASQMMEDVLFIEQSETEQIKLNLSWFDLGQLCRRAITAAEISTGRCIQFEVQQSQWCDRVYLDARLVRQVISNLLSNAIKYSSAQHPIQLKLVGASEWITLFVQDHGIGIPGADQLRLFDFFYRASNVGAVSGSGVGLAIVKHCVDLHQGTITVASEVGKGTLFKVTLPTNVMEVAPIPPEAD